jgi:hypothetical protein
MLPPQTLDQAKRLCGFDFDDDMYHVLLFDFGDDGGALGIWREGDDFCARIPLDSLVNFCMIAKAEAEKPEPVARAITISELIADSAPTPRLMRSIEKQSTPDVAGAVSACQLHWRDICNALRTL